ncbi:hypothetical protein quinque_014554 [Culex quinquefasciatus]
MCEGHGTPEYRTAFRALCEAFRTVSETQTKAIEEVKAELAETNERLTKVPKASVGRKVMKFAVPILPTTDGHDDMVWIWLSSFPPTVTEDDIRVMVRECLSFDDDEIIDVKMLVKKDADISKLRAVSFKVGVDLKHEETALDGDNWPAGVSFREFIFYDQKRFETELMEKHLSCIENIRRIAGPHDVIVVAGDYNQGSLVWKHLSGNRSYVDPQLTRTRTEKERLTHGVMLDGMANCNMHQCNLVKNDRNRILDLIFVSDDDCTVVAAADEPLVPLDAPHPALVFDIDASRTVFVQVDNNDRVLNYKRTNFDELQRTLADVDWTPVTSAMDVDTAIREFSNLLNFHLAQHTPQFRTPPKPEWSNARLKRLKKERAAALKTFTLRRCRMTKLAFNAASSRYRRYNRYRYNVYIRKTQSQLRRNPKKSWTFVKSKYKERGLPATMALGDSTATTNDEKCELFARHFSSVFREPEIISSTHHLDAVPRDLVDINTFVISRDMIEKATKKLKLVIDRERVNLSRDRLKECYLMTTWASNDAAYWVTKCQRMTSAGLIKLNW